MMNSSKPADTGVAVDTPAKEAALKSGTSHDRVTDHPDRVWDRTRILVAVATAAITLLILLLAGSSRAQGTARAWGMGGAGIATSRGLEAVAANPANLAFGEGMTFGLATVAVDVHNNALSLNRYNEITGQYLDHADKARLMSDIPETGLTLNADVSTSALGYQTGNFAISFGGLGAGQGNLDKDYFDLVLNGNQLGQTVDFSNTWGEGYAVGSLTLSYGRVVLDLEGYRVSVGANARYLQGIYEMHVAEAYGTLSTSLTEIAGEAYVATESARGGQGYGLDLGFAVQTDNGWNVGLAFDNVLGTVNWIQDVQRREMRVSAADINLLAFDLDAAVADADTSFATGGYTTNLPRRARLGAARKFGSFLVAADWVQGFEDRSLTSTHPLLNAGVEWRVSSYVQPRLGLSAGGDRGGSASAGVGFKVGPWRLDAAAIARNGVLVGDNKGLGVALGSLLQF